MNARVLASIDEVDPGSWNAVAGTDRLICRHEFLRAVEKSNINDCRYYYPVVYDGETIIAHACLYSISTELDTFARGGLKALITAVRRRWKGFLMLRTLECGTPVALGTTISIRQGADRAAALGRIEQEMARVAREKRIRVLLLRDFHAPELDLYDSLMARGYTRIHNLPRAHLAVRWKRFDHYLDAMRSEYRSKLRAIRDKCRQAGATLEIRTGYAGLAPQMAQLWRNTFQRVTEYRREVLEEDFFRSMALHLGDRSAVIAAEIDGRLVGFLLLLLDRDTLIPLFCGLDYSCSREAGIYFNLFYKAIEVAIDRGFSHIDFGITTLAPKMDLGAVVVPLYMYMKHSGPLLRTAVPKMFALMTPQSAENRRNVFKHGSRRASD